MVITPLITNKSMLNNEMKDYSGIELKPKLNKNISVTGPLADVFTRALNTAYARNTADIEKQAETVNVADNKGNDELQGLRNSERNLSTVPAMIVSADGNLTGLEDINEDEGTMFTNSWTFSRDEGKFLYALGNMNNDIYKNSRSGQPLTIEEIYKQLVSNSRIDYGHLIISKRDHKYLVSLLKASKTFFDRIAKMQVEGQGALIGMRYNYLQFLDELGRAYGDGDEFRFDVKSKDADHCSNEELEFHCGIDFNDGKEVITYVKADHDFRGNKPRIDNTVSHIHSDYNDYQIKVTIGKLRKFGVFGGKLATALAEFPKRAKEDTENMTKSIIELVDEALSSYSDIKTKLSTLKKAKFPSYINNEFITFVEDLAEALGEIKKTHQKTASGVYKMAAKVSNTLLKYLGKAGISESNESYQGQYGIPLIQRFSLENEEDEYSPPHLVHATTTHDVTEETVEELKDEIRTMKGAFTLVVDDSQVSLESNPHLKDLEDMVLKHGGKVYRGFFVKTK